uniref:NADH-ubiquinone oxidoreductase chain 5 n=1 Tax=Aleurochiton aceris TaxID=266942 RepID=Q697H5_ALEAC|nr:NADH dehydrogenase subunit 5 [Aleurochiton aceris]
MFFIKYISLTVLMMSLILFLLNLIFMKKMFKLIIEWKLVTSECLNMNFLLMIDTKSLMFSSCVFMITTSIIVYSKLYMENSNKLTTFIKIIMLFIMSMTILIFSTNMISMLLGWESLGLTSFVLIMFYQNKKSIMSAMYTMIMNRFGDIMILISMLNMMNLNTWSYTSTMINNNITILSLLMVGAFSKSAQIPFSSWLTEAMAAPTPISALVHSSTLVTAGIYLIIRFEESIKYKTINMVIFLISLTTLIMASMNSLTEMDLKKLVALSTLTQLSTMFITVSMNLYELAMFHIVVHAMFKALIFLCSSTFIACNNTQDMRKMKTNEMLPVTTMSINIASLSLCGFPFISGFYSKDLIMEMILVNKLPWVSAIIFYLCMLCTLIYSMKMMTILNMKKSKMTVKNVKEKNEQVISKLILLTPTIVLGNKTNWMININYKIAQVSYTEKILPIVLTTIVATMMNKFYMFNYQEITTPNKMKIFMTMNTYMWFMKNFNLGLKKYTIMFYFLSFKNSEKGMFTKTISTMILTTFKQSKMWFVITHKSYKNINLMIFVSMLMIT